MMPFLIHDLTSLPKKLRVYDFMIEHCKKNMLGLDPDDKNRVAYLTVTESRVKKNETQRRPGLHVEKPHSSQGDSNMFESMFGGAFLDGGIFMASNVDSTCRIWNAHVKPSEIGWEGTQCSAKCLITTLH